MGTEGTKQGVEAVKENMASFNFPSSLSTLSTPGYRRSVLMRRLVAGLLIICAVLLALSGRAAKDPQVVVFARDVAPGTVLSADDVELRSLPSNMVPTNAVTDHAKAEGQVIAAAASAGEVLTTTRITGPDLVSSIAHARGADASSFTLVPVKLAEPDIIPMLHHGDEVSVVTTGGDSADAADTAVAAARTIATGGTVITAGSGEAQTGVLLLLRNEDAVNVAASSLTLPLTVVLTGGQHRGE